MDKFTTLCVRVKPELHRKLKMEAARTGVRVQALVEQALEWRIGRVRITEPRSDAPVQD